jgi:hypothetical protein
VQIGGHFHQSGRLKAVGRDCRIGAPTRDINSAPSLAAAVETQPFRFAGSQGRDVSSPGI